jgi:bifunctional UDP-N-acetylglucosamine pyrophosphorylase/glucosamine-1-phosphate N-acetyltransferase
MRAQAAVILAVGQGTRMKSALPKVLHPIGGRAMLDWTIDAALGTGCEKVVVVVSPQGEEIRARVEARLGADAVAVQHEALGTAHAVRAAEGALAGFEGDVIVGYADVPLVRAETYAPLLQMREAGADVAVLGFEAENPFGYGRMILGEGDVLERIVEEKEANVEERAVRLCNSGLLAADRATLFALLAQVGNANAKGEYYLTDVIGLARASGLTPRAALGAGEDVLGANSRAELAVAEQVFQSRMRRAAMEAGVTLRDPATVYFSHDTLIDADVVVEPNVVFGPGVTVATGALIRAFSHLEGVEVDAGVSVGPFARLGSAKHETDVYADLRVRGVRANGRAEAASVDASQGARRPTAANF